MVVALLTWGGACAVLVNSLFTTVPVPQVTFLGLRFTAWISITFICVAAGLWQAFKEPEIQR